MLSAAAMSNGSRSDRSWISFQKLLQDAAGSFALICWVSTTTSLAAAPSSPVATKLSTALSPSSSPSSRKSSALLATFVLLDVRVDGLPRLPSQAEAGQPFQAWIEQYEATGQGQPKTRCTAQNPKPSTLNPTPYIQPLNPEEVLLYKSENGELAMGIVQTIFRGAKLKDVKNNTKSPRKMRVCKPSGTPLPSTCTSRIRMLLLTMVEGNRFLLPQSRDPPGSLLPRRGRSR